MTDFSEESHRMNNDIPIADDRDKFAMQYQWSMPDLVRTHAGTEGAIWETQDLAQMNRQEDDLRDEGFLEQLESLEKRTAQLRERLRAKKHENSLINDELTRKLLENQLKHIQICEVKAKIADHERTIALREFLLENDAPLDAYESSSLHPASEQRTTSAYRIPAPCILSLGAYFLNKPGSEARMAAKQKVAELHMKREHIELSASKLTAITSTIGKQHDAFQERLEQIKQMHPLHTKLKLSEIDAEEWEKQRDIADPTGDILRNCTLGLDSDVCDSKHLLNASEREETEQLERKLYDLRRMESALQSQVERLSSRVQLQIRDRLVATNKLNSDKEANSLKLQTRAKYLERLQKHQSRLELRLRALTSLN